MWNIPDEDFWIKDSETIYYSKNNLVDLGNNQTRPKYLIMLDKKSWICLVYNPNVKCNWSVALGRTKSRFESLADAFHAFRSGGLIKGNLFQYLQTLGVLTTVKQDSDGRYFVACNAVKYLGVGHTQVLGEHCRDEAQARAAFVADVKGSTLTVNKVDGTGQFNLVIPKYLDAILSNP